MNDKGQEILNRVLAKGSLPSLSPLAVRLVDMAADERSSAKDLARIIEQDPGLTTRLLRLVNSTAYRRSHEEITSITRAVLMLGLREVRIMALSLSLRDTLPVKKGGPDYHLFWRASLHRAVLSREVARRLALAEVEEAFVAGLILDLGLPILLRALAAEELQGFPGFGAALKRQLAWEREALGLDHREVGEAVFRHWGLPEVLVLCQRLVNQDNRDELPVLTEVIDFARRATEAFFLPEKVITDIHQLAWRWFGFDDDTVNAILASSLVYVGEAAQVMEIDLDQQADLLEVMEKANSALSRLSSALEPHLRAMADGQAPPAPPAQEAGVAHQQRLQDQAVVNTLEAVVHEIRNPLMSVGGFARRLAKQLEDSGQVSKYAKVILAEASRLDQVLGEMNLLLSPYTPKILRMELVEAVRAVAEALPQQPEDQVCGPLPEVKWHLPTEALPLAGDPQGLAQALRQIIVYAAHLMRQSGCGGTLHVHLQARGQEAVITIFGPGQPPDPSRNAMAERAFGPELALAKARRIVEAHQGRLFTGPAPKGEGFVISAHLPRLRVAA